MSDISFFVPKGPFYLNDLSDELSDKNNKLKISDIKTLDRATKKDITFFNSMDYKYHAKKPFQEFYGNTPSNKLF